jgi:hypothetical protein
MTKLKKFRHNSVISNKSYPLLYYYKTIYSLIFFMTKMTKMTKKNIYNRYIF